MKMFSRTSIAAVAALIAVFGGSLIAHAQQTPTTPAPVPGAQGWYYNNPNGPIPPLANIGSPVKPNSVILQLGAQRTDGTIDFTTPGTNNPAPGMNAHRFNITWLGTITIPANGAYWFRGITDDGGRLWISRTLPFTTNFATMSNNALWKDQGDTNIDVPVDAAGTLSTVGMACTAGEKLYFRFEMYENQGGNTARLRWRTPASGANYVVIPSLAGGSGMETPGPCPTPVLTATSVPGAAAVQLNWTSPAATAVQTPPDSYNIYRGDVTGTTPARVLVGNSTTTSFTDTGAVGGPLTFGSDYFYVVQAVYSVGVLAPGTDALGMVFGNPSNEALCIVNPFALTPPTLTAIENGGIATYRITTSAAIPAGTTVSFNIAVAPIGAGPAAFTAPASVAFTGPVPAGSFITFDVTAVDDNKANLVRSVTITVGPSVSGTTGWSGHTLPPVTCTTIETDIPGVIITPGNGLAITNGGPAITFNVALSTDPDYPVTLNLGSTLPYAAVITPTPITLNSGNWNTGVTVTVTPNLNDTTTTYLTSFYVTFTPVTSLDFNYDGINPGSAYIYMPTSTPPLSSVWGSKSCGLTGVEGLVILGLLRFWRRRRNS